MENTSIVISIINVFTQILSWFQDAFSTVSAMFYSADEGLTFIGVVSFITLGVALFTLVIGWIRGLIR